MMEVLTVETMELCMGKVMRLPRRQPLTLRGSGRFHKPPLQPIAIHAPHGPQRTGLAPHAEESGRKDMQVECTRSRRCKLRMDCSEENEAASHRRAGQMPGVVATPQPSQARERKLGKLAMSQHARLNSSSEEHAVHVHGAAGEVNHWKPRRSW